jgi:hypothetical protein
MAARLYCNGTHLAPQLLRNCTAISHILHLSFAAVELQSRSSYGAVSQQLHYNLAAVLAEASVSCRRRAAIEDRHFSHILGCEKSKIAYIPENQLFVESAHISLRFARSRSS